MLFALAEGWRWVEGGFKFSSTWQSEDLNSDVTDSHRTMLEVTKAMSSLISYIQFEGEEPGMFCDSKLPTLDTAIWWNGESFMYEFWEKPTVPNRVIQKDTALAESTIRSSLNQEVVRRLLNCSKNLEPVKKAEILSVFSQKLINSGFSIPSAQITLVHGVARFVEIMQNSELPKSHPRYKPVHFNKNFKKCENKLKKYLDKANWYENDGQFKSFWRSKLPQNWRGAKSDQMKSPGMKFTSLLQVQNSKGGRLIKALSKIEPRLSKLSKYSVKMVEKGGKPLSKLFSKDFGDGKCSRLDCEPCKNVKKKGPTLCSVKNVVYESTCDACEVKFKSSKDGHHDGRYVGQTSRTLYERASEHVEALKNSDLDSFMFKHWALMHSDMDKAPSFTFNVVKCHKDPLSRLVHESVRISTHASMNSRAEWSGYKVARISVEPSVKEAKAKLDEIDKIDQGEVDAMNALKTRLAQLSTANKTLNCRKRSLGKMDGQSEISPIAKKSKKGPSSDVRSWLLTGKPHSSTPVKSEGKSVAGPDVIDGSSVGLAYESLEVSTQHASDPDVCNDELDSTESWFLTNVNSYCEAQGSVQADGMNATADVIGASTTENGKVDEICSIESTTSSFLAAAGITRPKLVDYSSSIGSKNGSLPEKLALSSDDGSPKTQPPANEHPMIPGGSATVVWNPEGEVSTLLSANAIENFVNYPGPSILSNMVYSLHSSLNSQYSSMVSHVIDSNVVYAQKTDANEPHIVDLWQHLTNVKACSFVRAASIKRARDDEKSLCRGFERLHVRKAVDLCDEFKKLCVRESLAGASLEAPSPPTDVRDVGTDVSDAVQDVSKFGAQCADASAEVDSLDPELCSSLGNGEPSSACVPPDQ